MSYSSSIAHICGWLGRSAIEKRVIGKKVIDNHKKVCGLKA
ncbi:hypothetical protein [Microcoleus sp. CAWBG58]|nr:hypothetical protein [Microcoleus sp. CAWBG58]